MNVNKEVTNRTKNLYLSDHHAIYPAHDRAIFSMKMMPWLMFSSVPNLLVWTNWHKEKDYVNQLFIRNHIITSICSKTKKIYGSGQMETKQHLALFSPHASVEPPGGHGGCHRLLGDWTCERRPGRRDEFIPRLPWFWSSRGQQPAGIGSVSKAQPTNSGIIANWIY